MRALRAHADTARVLTTRTHHAYTWNECMCIVPAKLARRPHAGFILRLSEPVALRFSSPRSRSCCVWWTCCVRTISTERRCWLDTGQHRSTHKCTDPNDVHGEFVRQKRQSIKHQLPSLCKHSFFLHGAEKINRPKELGGRIRHRVLRLARLAVCEHQHCDHRAESA